MHIHMVKASYKIGLHMLWQLLAIARANIQRRHPGRSSLKMVRMCLNM